MTFAEIVDAVSNFSIEEQEMFITILRQRMVEKKRERLLADIEEGRKDFREGRIRAATSDEIMRELLS